MRSDSEIYGPQPRIRPVETSHIADLIRIAEETNLSHWSAQSYVEEMKNPNAILLRLVGDDNITLGFVVGRIITAAHADYGHDADIYNIAVTKFEQRRGFGQLLFEAFRAKCTRGEVGNIWLEVRESNAAAIAFYERNGFSRVQTRNHFYENPREHALLMRLPLKQSQA